MELTLDEAVEYLKDGGEITLTATDGYEYGVSHSSNWVGGDVADGYISSVLGNVIYDSARAVLEDSIKFLENYGGHGVTITEN